MVLLNFFNWTFEAHSQAPIPQTEGIAIRVYTTMALALLVLGLLLALILSIYFLTVKAQTSGGMCNVRESPMVESVRPKQIIKRRKTKKAGKPRLTKTQKLQEVNRKWHEIYGSENSDREEKEDLGTVPFGSVEITGAKKVSFRDIIKDVYVIESKEEVKHLEQLQRLGYDVTIGRHQPFACEMTSEPASKIARCEEKENISAPRLYPYFDSSSNDRDVSDVTQRVSKKWLNATDFEMEGSKTSNGEAGLSNHFLDDEDRLLNMPLFTETSV